GRSSFQSDLREALQPGWEQQNVTLPHDLDNVLLGFGALQNHVSQAEFGNRAPQYRLIAISSASHKPEEYLREMSGCPQKIGQTLALDYGSDKEYGRGPVRPGGRRRKEAKIHSSGQNV